MNSYIIITDLHDWSNNKSHRKDYLAEIDFVKEVIIELVRREKNRGNNAYPIFLGDIFDRGFKDITRALQVNNYFVELNNVADKVYSVVGNHEITFYKDNPFWSLLGELDSVSLSRIRNKRIEPKGSINLINVVDELTDGEVSFYFNHSGTLVPEPKNVYNILLSHNDITTGEILDAQKMKDTYIGNYIDFQKSGNFKGYNLVYLGHEHKRYSKVDITERTTGSKVTVHNLASLGRTSHGEISNDFLERTIPIVRVKDGKLDNIEDFKFDLMTREECVIESKIQEQSEKRIMKNILKEVIKYKPTTDNPLNNIRQAFGNNELYNIIIDGLVENKNDALYDKIVSDE